MATTIHIPPPLLARVDACAKALGVSRNRLILDALESTLETKREWAPELVRILRAPLSSGAADELSESLAHVRRNRVNRKRAPKL